MCFNAKSLKTVSQYAYNYINWSSSRISTNSLRQLLSSLLQ